MTFQNKKQMLPNALGTAGYTSCLLQWFWLVMLYLDTISPIIQPLIATQEYSAPSPVAPVAQSEPSLLLLFLTLAIIIAAIVISVMALVKIPRAIANGGKRITHVPAEFIVPVIASRHPLKPLEKRQLSRRIIFGAKLLICSIPATIPLLVPTDTLPWPVVVTVTLFLLAVSLSFFCLQALVGKLMGVSYEKSS